MLGKRAAQLADALPQRRVTGIERPGEQPGGDEQGLRQHHAPGDAADCRIGHSYLPRPVYAVQYTVHMATATGKLSRERILDAAGRLVENDGLDGLSMRRLAQELDVWPMSVYRYFQDKDALLEALAGSAVAKVTVPRGGHWRKQLRALLADLLTVIGGQPAEMRQRIGRSIVTPGNEPIS